MTIRLQAIYENGVFKPKQPVTLEESMEVELTLHTPEDAEDPLEAVIRIGNGPPEGDGAQNHDKHICGKLRG